MSKIRKQRMLLVFPLAVLLLGMILTSILLLQTYRKIAFEHISAFCETILESSPEAEPELLSALKEYHSMTDQEIARTNYLEQYGYRADEFCKELPPHIFLLPLMLFLAAACTFTFGILALHRQNRKRIAELTEYLERVNTGADGILIQTQEDDFSHLQDELYKTVTTLCQTREAAVSAKMNFAENLANIAHQLKTPITAAFLSLQLLKKETSSDYVNQTERQLERLNRLEESLLTLSKIDAGTLPLKHEQVDLYTVLNLAAENLSDLLRKDHISVEIPENGCIEFSGDLEWTMEALINLLKNCMEHSRPGGTVHCDYLSNPLYAEIQIWDDGTGFDTEDLPHLFERFYRGRRAVGSGIGIGLALAKEIFELQNGTIQARNLQGGGACFEIKIYRH